jgi:hypothetical protein
MLRRGAVQTPLERLFPGGDETDLVQLELFPGNLGDDQVPMVDWIE